MHAKFVFVGSVIAGLSLLGSCKTSSDLARARGREFVDPTNVVTSESTVNVSQTSAQSEDLERQIEILKGQLEEEKLSAARNQEILNAKIQELQGVNAALVAQLGNVKAPEPSLSGAGETGAQGAEKLWNLAMEDLAQGKFEVALSGVSEIAKTYPKDKLVFDALMMKGLLHYKLTQFNEAALSFNQVIDRFPKRKSIALAWFGQGASFAQMKRPDDSKIFFEELVRKYPQSPEAKRAEKILTKKEKVPADLLPLAQGKNGKITL